jgi:hypothetical protein
MSLKTKDIELIVLILQILIKYGYPALISFIATLGKDEFTLEDIQGFKIDDDEPFIP